MRARADSSRYTVMLAMASVFAALVYVATAIFMVNIPSTSGYLNFGETVIYLGAFLFGPFIGAFSGGIGASVADALSPYVEFAPGTLAIKSIEGALVGFLNIKILEWTRKHTFAGVISIIVGGSEMILGYFLYEAFALSYGVSAALVEVPFNIVQMTVGLVVAVPVYQVILRVFPQLRNQNVVMP
jgi:uncharacterized membrane protein